MAVPPGSYVPYGPAQDPQALQMAQGQEADNGLLRHTALSPSGWPPGTNAALYTTTFLTPPQTLLPYGPSQVLPADLITYMTPADLAKQTFNFRTLQPNRDEQYGPAHAQRLTQSPYLDPSMPPQHGRGFFPFNTGYDDSRQSVRDQNWNMLPPSFAPPGAGGLPNALNIMNIHNQDHGTIMNGFDVNDPMTHQYAMTAPHVTSADDTAFGGIDFALLNHQQFTGPKTTGARTPVFLSSPPEQMHAAAFIAPHVAQASPWLAVESGQRHRLEESGSRQTKLNRKAVNHRAASRKYQKTTIDDQRKEQMFHETEDVTPYDGTFHSEAECDAYLSGTRGDDCTPLDIDDDDLDNVTEDDKTEYCEQLLDAILEPSGPAPLEATAEEVLNYDKQQAVAFKYCEANIGADNYKYARACCDKLYYRAVALHERGIPTHELSKRSLSSTNRCTLDLASKFSERMEKIISAVSTNKRVACDVLKLQRHDDLVLSSDSFVERKVRNCKGNGRRGKDLKEVKARRIQSTTTTSAWPSLAAAAPTPWPARSLMAIPGNDQTGAARDSSSNPGGQWQNAGMFTDQGMQPFQMQNTGGIASTAGATDYGGALFGPAAASGYDGTLFGLGLTGHALHPTVSNNPQTLLGKRRRDDNPQHGEGHLHRSS
ncbi:hypothetical protein LTR10_008322 [Elasticomyces elasticus]|nr:hypothetical protein LTR10_008322 [Elasticomyces elasticus]KAK4967197.1 hypothetical protein LTR42_010546 [Elasticomyces elasticus]